MQQYLQEVLSLDKKEHTLNASSLQEGFINDKEDEVTRALLEFYDRKYSVDLQKELQNSLEPMTIEKIEKELALKDDKTSRKEEAKEKVAGQIKDSHGEVQVGKEAKEQLEKEVEEKLEKGEEIDEESMHEQLLKAVYDSALEEYMKLKLESQRVQIKTGEFATKEKIDTKMILCEAYLRKVDIHYKTHYGSYINQADPEIEEKEKEFFGASVRNHKKINKNARQDMNQILEIQEELVRIADDIARLNLQEENMDFSEYMEKMQNLKDEYMQTNRKLRVLSPNPAELIEDIEQREEIENFRDRKLGSNTRNAGVYKEEGIIRGRKSNKELQRGEHIEEKVVENTQNNAMMQQENLEIAVKDLERDFLNLGDGNPEELCKILQRINQIGMTIDPDIQKIDMSELATTPEEDNHTKNQEEQLEKQYGNDLEYIKKQVVSPDELALRDTCKAGISRLYEKLNMQKSPEKSKEIKEILK